MPLPIARRRGFTLVELLVVLAILLVIAALLTPALADARDAARRSQCKNNLKQITIALHNYHETYDCFPPGWISTDSMPDKNYGYGWGFSLLPFVEQGRLYNAIALSQPMPAANKLLQTKISSYRCPVDPTPAINPLRSNYGTSNYSGNAGTHEAAKTNKKGSELTSWLSPRRTQFWPGEVPVLPRSNGIFWMNSRIRIRDISDGTANTFCIGERGIKSGAAIWPGVGRNDFADDVVTHCAPGNEINKRFTSFSSGHPGGAYFALCDGSVRFVNETIKPQTFRDIATRAGGEVIPEF